LNVSARVRERHERLARVGPLPTRGGRFAARQNQTPLPRLEMLYAVARWRLAPQVSHGRIRNVCVLLYHRHQLARTLDGAVLRVATAQCGDALFDRALATDLTEDIASAQGDVLREGDDWHVLGAALLARAESGTDPAARRLADLATKLVLENAAP